MRRLPTLVALAATVTLSFSGVASATHSWNGYHWARTSNPFTLKVGDNVSAKWDPYLATTSTDWSKSTVLDTRIVAGSTKPRSCRGTTGRVEVCNAAYGSTGWLGIASISITGGSHITRHREAQRHLLRHDEVQHLRLAQPRLLPGGGTHPGS